MRRTELRVLALALVLSLPLIAAPARAQDASPPAEEEMLELPPGVALAILAQIAPFDLPDEPVSLVVLRLTVEPGVEIPSHPHPGGEFGIAEAGSVMVRTIDGPAVQVLSAAAAEAGATPEPGGSGVAITISAGDVFIIPAGNVSETRAGPAGATALIFEFAPAAEGTPEA